MNKEEERNYVFAQLSSLPNAFQYVSVTNYIENLEQENKELKEHIEKYEHYCKTTGIEELMKENQKYKEVIDKAIEYMKDFIFEPLLTNEDRKLIMYNDNLRNFEKILKEVE